MKNIAVIALLTLTSGLAEAGTWTKGQIVASTMWQPGYQGFYVSENFHDPEGCGNGKGHANSYAFDPSFVTSESKTVDRLYAMILTAHSTGSKLRVLVDGCLDTVPRIIGLDMERAN